MALTETHPMKDAQLRVRSLVTALILLLFTSFAARAQENGGDDFLSNLHQFRVSNYMSLDAYYRFSAVGDTETLNEIVASINQANDAMNSVADNASSILSDEQVESLNQEFDEFKSLMRSNINDVRNTGYPDLRLVSDMANQAITLNQSANELYMVAQESNETNTDPRVEAARSAAVTMAQMMAKYSARTNSQVAQTFQGSSSDVPLDEQARLFDTLLADVKKGDASGELKSTLDNLSSKWQFIRSSYINFNDNNVAFVIDRYSKGILDGLETAIGLLLGSA
jgi:cell pole-organizing protein PopZ